MEEAAKVSGCCLMYGISYYNEFPGCQESCFSKDCSYFPGEGA